MARVMKIMTMIEMTYLPVGEEKRKCSNCKGDEEVLDEQPPGQGGDRGVHLDDHHGIDDDKNGAHW